MVHILICSSSVLSIQCCKGKPQCFCRCAVVFSLNQFTIYNLLGLRKSFGFDNILFHSGFICCKMHPMNAVNAHLFGIMQQKPLFCIKLIYGKFSQAFHFHNVIRTSALVLALNINYFIFISRITLFRRVFYIPTQIQNQCF